jgi:hypothetical protein
MKIKSVNRPAPCLACATLILSFWTLALPWQAAAMVGSWTPLNSSAPGNAEHMLLLSDGTVMVQNAPVANSTNWFRLTPDMEGSYADGGWSNTSIHPAHKTREFYESFVIPDGRVVFAGGEYGTGTNDVEVYDPFSNSWTTPLQSPAPNILDASSELLPDGNLLVSPWYCNLSPPFITLIYNPTLNTWSSGPDTIGSQNEATWVKLPDESILTIDRCTINGSCNNDQSPASCYTNTERFIPSLNHWIPDAPLPPDLQLWANVEIGAALLLPNGKVFFLGGSGQTGIYTPSGNTSPGSWASGANIPNGYQNQDAPAAMLVNGKILCAVSPPGGDNVPPVFFYEYDYLTDSFESVNSPTGGSSDNNCGANRISLLDLPNGQVLFSDTTGQLYVYTPNPVNEVTVGQPAIGHISLNLDGSYHLVGTGLNGISEGAAFGDDAQMDSNYPLVRLTDASGDVYYGQTYNWSSTGVMTGSAQVTTEFTVSASAGAAYSLVVVANGIASDAVTFYGPIWVDFNYTGIFQFGDFTFPYTNLATAVSAVPSGGTIALNGSVQPSTSSETLTISTPMTITAYSGPSTIGR